MGRLPLIQVGKVPLLATRQILRDTEMILLAILSTCYACPLMKAVSKAGILLSSII